MDKQVNQLQDIEARAQAAGDDKRANGVHAAMAFGTPSLDVARELVQALGDWRRLAREDVPWLIARLRSCIAALIMVESECPDCTVHDCGRLDHAEVQRALRLLDGAR